MTSASDLEQKRREEARWRILRALDAGRPIETSEQIVLRVLDDLKLAYSVSELRRELTYLRDRGLVNIHGEDGETWRATLTAAGVDFVEYTIPARPGIARPKR